MKLSQYAKANGIGYRAAWNRYRAGKITGAYLDESGHVVIPDPQHEHIKKAVIYARVSTHKQKDDLQRQADRMVAFANAAGLSVVAVVTEVAPGVNDNRPKLTKLLQRDDWGTLVVEHKDRLARVGFNWFEVLLAQQGRNIAVANTAQDETADLMDDLAAIIQPFAIRLHGPRSGRRRTDSAMAALQAPNAD